ncbi:MAG: Gfo/Idh/MocA family oxidoreductase [Gammaproteobacteria bacterium]|nr:Gfo/Idh/MocA family oxidoreductase [Gammaproteobacteria bacterium]
MTFNYGFWVNHSNANRRCWCCRNRSFSESWRKKIALIGAGVQAEWQIKALHAIDRVSRVCIYDINKNQSKQLSQKLEKELKIPSFIASSEKEAIDQCNILIIATPSKKPIITSKLLHSGLHINAFGADQPGKVELEADVINKNLIVVDDKKLALTHGALNVAFKNNQLDLDHPISEIGEILAHKKGRSSTEEISIFGNVGLAFQDLVACSIVYKNALKLGKGSWIDLDNSLIQTNAYQANNSLFLKNLSPNSKKITKEQSDTNQSSIKAKL